MLSKGVVFGGITTFPQLYRGRETVMMIVHDEFLLDHVSQQSQTVKHILQDQLSLLLPLLSGIHI